MDLKVGDIVKYDGEYGLVIETPKCSNGKYISGDLLVRWDTEDDSDIESCLGNLEAFLEKVSDYQFKYIKK